MKIKILAFVTVILLCVGNLFAQLSISSTFAFESEYVFRGVQFADESFQPSVELSHGGFYIGTWVNQPIVDPGAAFLNEVDFYGGYGFSLGEVISVDIGATYYWFPEEPTSADETREPFIGLSADVLFTPTVYFYYDFDLDTFTAELSASHSIELSDTLEGSTLDIGIYGGFVVPDTGGGDYNYFGGSIDWGYAFTEYASFSIGIRFTATDISAARDSNFWWGAGFSAGF